MSDPDSNMLAMKDIYNLPDDEYEAAFAKWENRFFAEYALPTTQTQNSSPKINRSEYSEQSNVLLTQMLQILGQHKTHQLDYSEQKVLLVTEILYKMGFDEKSSARSGGIISEMINFEKLGELKLI